MSQLPLPILEVFPVRGRSKRGLLLAGVAVAIVAIWFVAKWASTPTYVTLYRDLALSDAGTIDERLRKAGIDHKLSAGGTEVLVPVSDLARARVSLAKDGLPRDGRPGLELFDKPAWGMTDFTQRVTYQRALEGELARTIAAIQGIEKAQVHLVLPTPSPLRRLERPASASVVLTLSNGNSLAPETVRGITYIVSNSVEHLANDNVAVMDDAGHILSIPSGEGSAAGMASWQMEVERSVEQQTADKIVQLLETVVGTGGVRAQVSVDMNFDQVDATTETYDPESQVLQSEQRSETESGGEGSGAQVVINNAYQSSRRMERNISSVGKVARLTAAILVDEKAMVGKGPGGGALETNQLQQMVVDAIGLDSSRGDRISVVAVPFGALTVPGNAPDSAPEKQKPDILGIVERVARPLIGLVAVISLMIFGFRLLKPAGVGRTLSAAASGASGRDAGAPALPGGGGDVVMLPNQRSGEMAGQSDARARVLRSWLSES
jgi:flagellar M-ring protein FliF